jgi:hypothetical protein
MDITTWSAWASPLVWTIGTLAASWMIGHFLVPCSGHGWRGE